MFCTNCGKKIKNNEKFCTKCGEKTLNASNDGRNSKSSQTSKSFLSRLRGNWDIGEIIGVTFVILLIGVGIYNSLDEDAVNINDKGLSSFSAGDSEQAAYQLQRASEEAVRGDTKLTTLKNLGYVYSSEGEYQKALDSFRKALKHTEEGTFDYYLVSGEIALLEGKPNSAQISYQKAYEKRPENFQINNALALFYLDLEELNPEFENYSMALEHAQKAHRVSDSHTKEIAKENLAIAHLMNENYERSISLFSSFNINKKPYAAYWLGMAYLANGDEQNGIYYLRQAQDAGIELEPFLQEYLSN